MAISSSKICSQRSLAFFIDRTFSNASMACVGVCIVKRGLIFKIEPTNAEAFDRRPPRTRFCKSSTTNTLLKVSRYSFTFLTMSSKSSPSLANLAASKAKYPIILTVKWESIGTILIVSFICSASCSTVSKYPVIARVK